MVITGRQEAALTAAAAEIGGGCFGVVCDQRDPQAVRVMAQRVLEECGPPDILVNNAGVHIGGTVMQLSLDQWDQTLETNLRGVFLVTQAFLPGMIARERGDIFMISSMSGKKGDPGASAYAASKFGLQGFSQALLYEVRRHNIRVSVLNPSSVDTGPDPADGQIAGRYLHAADLAETIVYLACLPGRTLLRDLDLWGTNP